jgi:predicted CxxxxCH...CXXCH cytochrome family protein
MKSTKHIINKVMTFYALLMLFILLLSNNSFAQSPTITLGSNPEECQGTISADLTYSATTDSPDEYSIDWSATANTEGFSDFIDAALPVSPISLTVPGGANGGIYFGSLTVKNSGTGLSSGSYPISVTISGATPGAISGYTIVNPGISGYEYTIEPVINATTYTWSVPTNWNIYSGTGTNSILVTSSPNLIDDGDITVSATTPLCGVSPVSTLAVNVDDVTDHSDINCSSCHTFHNATGSTLTNATANEGLCLSCHVVGQIAERKDFVSGDKAIPGVSGNSHSWDALAVNSTYETNLPTSPEMAARLTIGDSIVCSTCHDQHNGALASPYIRIDNTNDAICKDCHSARDVGLYTDVTPGYGSHPVDVILDTVGVRFGESPTLATHNDSVQCSTCHGIHDVTDATLTTDGNLLKMANDNNLCLDCHAYSSHQGQTCITCHQVHNTDKSNIYMIRDLITTPISGDKTVVFTAETGTNSFADGDATYDGVCEVCHTTNASTYHYNTSAGDHTHEAGTNCTVCHTHDTDFTAPACTDCHITNFPNWGTTDSHFAHTGKYSYTCNTCHFERGSGTDYHLFTDALDVTDGVAEVNINPNGLATRGGLDANSPTYTAGTKTCANIYCHSNGRSAYRGTDGTYTWSSTTGSQTATYAPIPAWDSSTDVSCALGDPLTGFACHEGPPGVEAVPNFLINATNHGSMINANDYFPKTGSHAPNRGAHYSNSQNLSGNGWSQVQCFYCHETDDVLTPAPNEKYQGTYGTSLHVDGQIHFDPRWHSNGGTIVNTMTYSYEGSKAHCGAGKSCW